MSDTEDDEDTRQYAVVLDFLAHGRADDDRPQYQRSPVAYAIGESEFRLYELVFADDTDVTIGDRIVVAPEDERTGIKRFHETEYEDLSGGAQSEVEYVIEEIVEREEQRFVDVYNNAQPISLRLHQLNLLPGIGKKLRNTILDERKRKPFESFDEIEERVDGLHDPQQVLVDRILEELREDDLKYRIFAVRDEEE